MAVLHPAHRGRVHLLLRAQWNRLAACCTPHLRWVGGYGVGEGAGRMSGGEALKARCGAHMLTPTLARTAQGLHAVVAEQCVQLSHLSQLLRAHTTPQAHTTPSCTGATRTPAEGGMGAAGGSASTFTFPVVGHSAAGACHSPGPPSTPLHPHSFASAGQPVTPQLLQPRPNPHSAQPPPPTAQQPPTPCAAMPAHAGNTAASGAAALGSGSTAQGGACGSATGAAGEWAAPPFTQQLVQQHGVRVAALLQATATTSLTGAGARAGPVCARAHARALPLPSHVACLFSRTGLLLRYFAARIAQLGHAASAGGRAGSHNPDTPAGGDGRRPRPRTASHEPPECDMEHAGRSPSPSQNLFSSPSPSRTAPSPSCTIANDENVSPEAAGGRWRGAALACMGCGWEGEVADVAALLAGLGAQEACEAAAAAAVAKDVHARLVEMAQG